MSCRSQKIKEVNDENTIFQKVVDQFHLNDMYILKEAENKEVYRLLKNENSIFNTWEFNSFYSISFEEAQNILNDKELEIYRSQIDENFQWPNCLSSNLILKQALENLRDNGLKDINKRGELKFKNFATISKPIYNSNKDLALVYYGYSDVYTKSVGEAALLMFIKENGQWKYYTSLISFII